MPASAIYTGWVGHRRFQPVPHGFNYRLFMMYLDLDELRRQLQLSVELAPTEDVESVFEDCALGAVPPLGPAYGIESVWDEQLMSEPELYFEFGDHRHLVHVRTRDYLALLESERHGSFSEPMLSSMGLWGTA